MSWYLPEGTVIPDLYADPGDYFAWTQVEAPANIVPILRACSSLVADATEGDYYSADPATGLPTDPRILAAFRDATCAQAAAWVALKIDPATGGVQVAAAGAATMRKLGSGMIGRSDAEAAAVAAAIAAARTSLVPDAVRILRRNGLGSAGVWTLG